MADLDAYYESDPPAGARREPARFPPNHVNFHPVLRALPPVVALARRLGFDPLQLTGTMARLLDAQAPMLRELGSERELEAVRSLAEQGHRGLDENPYLSDQGRLLLKLMHVQTVRERGKVLRFAREHEAHIAKRGRYVAPVVIAGLPRTGSTLLQRLLCQDPNSRSPHTYEMESPLPPLQESADPLADPRIARSVASLNIVKRLFRGHLEKFAESHLWSATEFEEATPYMVAHFGLTLVNAPQAGRAYSEAMSYAPQAMRPVLRYERRFFTMLDAYRPARSHWVQKSPFYTPNLPELFDEYPDARVIVTHRNPATVVPSVIRLMESWNVAFDRDGCFDKWTFGEMLADTMRPMVEVPMRLRDERPELASRVFDCMYDALFGDPIGTVRRIYDQFGLEYTPEFERRMRRYLDDNRQGKYGRHRYSLEEYGLTPERIHELYGPYMQRHGYRPDAVVQRAASLLETGAGS